jgi:hypothetical protein
MVVARNRNALMKAFFSPINKCVTPAGSDFSPSLSAALCRQADGLQIYGAVR